MLLSHHAVKDTKDSCVVHILEIGVELEQVCHLRFLCVS